MALRDDSPGDDIKDIAANKLANAGKMMHKGRGKKKRGGRRKGKGRG
jgi:hypothetical protein